eukprot:7931644-Alexandrium_andersonii.AAC.1
MPNGCLNGARVTSKVANDRYAAWARLHRDLPSIPPLTYLKLHCPMRARNCRRFKGWPELDLKAALIKAFIMYLGTEMANAALLP